MARCERGRSIPNASGSASQTWQNCRAGSRRPTRSGWSAFWETDPPTHRGWRLSYSTRVRRSTWRELAARSPKATAGRGKSGSPARRGARPRWYRRRLPIIPDDANHPASGAGGTGGDKSEQRQFRGAGLALGGDDFDRPALVMRAPDVPFALEIGEVLVNRRQRLEAKLAGNFLEAGGVPLFFDVLSDVVQDLALAPRDRHSSSRRYTET